jgi:hypothetical protein
MVCLFRIIQIQWEKCQASPATIEITTHPLTWLRAGRSYWEVMPPQLRSAVLNGSMQSIAAHWPTGIHRLSSATQSVVCADEVIVTPTAVKARERYTDAINRAPQAVRSFS